MFRIKRKCPKCRKRKFWKTKDKRLKCKHCRKMFTAKNNLYGLSRDLLRQIISEFLLEH